MDGESGGCSSALGPYTIASVIDSGVEGTLRLDQIEPTEMPFLSRRRGGVQAAINWVLLFVTFLDRWDPIYAGYASTILHLRRSTLFFFPFLFPFFAFPIISRQGCRWVPMSNGLQQGVGSRVMHGRVGQVQMIS